LDLFLKDQDIFEFLLKDKGNCRNQIRGESLSSISLKATAGMLSPRDSRTAGVGPQPSGYARPFQIPFHPSATGSLASAASPSPPHRRRRVASLMDQPQASPSGRNNSRSSSQWPRPELGFDLGFLLGRRPRPGGEKLDPANWLRRLLSPPPTAEAEAEGKAVGSHEEQVVGAEDADHLVVTVNGLYGRFVFGGFASGYVLLC
jgi:hypothetical protein